jgi:hypothetical protein
MTYVCEGCGATFEGHWKDAYNEGWDTPEMFVSHCTCPNCTIDKTIWWKLQVEKMDPAELTPEQIQLLMEYNQMYAIAQAERQNE